MRPAPDRGDGLIATGLDLLLDHARIGAVSDNLEDAGEAAQVPRSPAVFKPIRSLAVLMHRMADHHARMPKATPVIVFLNRAPGLIMSFRRQRPFHPPP